MGISLREYARRRGVSHVAVMKAIKVGRITPESDGSLDPAKVDAQWDDRTDPARRPERSGDERAGTDPAAASDSDESGDEVAQVRPPAAAEPASQGTGASFTQARTAHEIAKAQRARIEVQRLREEVVDRAHATAEVFRLARRERDAWVNWPGRKPVRSPAQGLADLDADGEGLLAHRARIRGLGPTALLCAVPPLRASAMARVRTAPLGEGQTGDGGLPLRIL